MLDQLKHERAWSEKLLLDVYEDFLTPTEISSILDNKDIWMDGTEVIRRLELKKTKLEGATPEVKPKRKTKTTSDTPEK